MQLLVRHVHIVHVLLHVNVNVPEDEAAFPLTPRALVDLSHAMTQVPTDGRTSLRRLLAGRGGVFSTQDLEQAELLLGYVHVHVYVRAGDSKVRSA